ncbi:MAG: Stk1 family PASTA domain-containing Ser/Thr kinase [Gordonibacter sp.]|uniref:Stk1 family PASTA domain-containing Ser/Thr kinase n=2 Tax=Gordonibacter sp. TaxID=1968902 RepID=UPI002FC7F402
MSGNMTGRVFNNRYQITERIGIGGMAEVYRAQDNVLGRLVAVKVMLPQYAADPNFTARFKQEAAAAANLQSPYIVNVYDWGQDDGTYYIVMEFVRGSDLKTAINERGVINQRKVAEIGSQVCQALSVAHNLDIIHRDIKPQNIMVQPDGNVKVMDFGIARAKNSVMTQTSSVLGTAHYISPEQAQGKELTATSDIYSLGIVLYEAATGKLPFDGPDAVSVAMKQVNDLPAPPREINPDIDPALEGIIMRAMAKNTAERFATAQDMRYALNDYLAGRPVNVGAFTSAQTAVMGGIVPPMGAADGTAVMSAMGGANPVSTAGGPKNYRSDDGKKKSNKKTIGIVVAIIAALAIVGVGAFALMGGFASGDPVPDVTSKTVEEATALLEKSGFQVGNIQKVPDAKIAADKIISQDPKAGDKREKGSKVNLTVSTGVEQIAVPDLVGKTTDEAKQLLKEKGLVPSIIEGQHSDTVAKGSVISSNPAAGTKVNKGDTVELVPSVGSEGTEVPDVVGQLEGAATTKLNNAGFKVTFDYTASDTVAEGKVISQNPGAGTKLKKDESVNIVVSTGKQKPSTFTVTASAQGEGGYVSPSSMDVEEGGSVTFTVTPNSGYLVASVTDTNGKSYEVTPAGGTFTISGVKNSIAVTVTFKQTPPTPTPTPAPSGN